MLALVLEALREPQRKLLLFAHHAAVMSRLEQGLLAAGVPLVRIDGGTAHARREQCVAQFQCDVPTPVRVGLGPPLTLNP